MNTADKINKAILEINPTATFIIRGATPDIATVDGVEWMDGTTPIATADIEAKMVEVQAAYDAQAYARNRKAEYDQLNQFEMMFDDDRDSTTTWVDKINEIKGRHPKP